MTEDQKNPPEEEKSSLPNGLVAEVKDVILALNPKSKEHIKAVGELRASEVSIMSKKGATYVVHAGKFGVRKVTL